VKRLHRTARNAFTQKLCDDLLNFSATVQWKWSIGELEEAASVIFAVATIDGICLVKVTETPNQILDALPLHSAHEQSQDKGQRHNKCPRCRFVCSTDNGATSLSGYSKAMARLERESDVTWWTPHDLRRTARTLRVSSSATLTERRFASSTMRTSRFAACR
jgi:hypothetical protein